MFFTVERRWDPLIVFYLRGKCSDDEFRAYLDAMEVFLYEPRRYGFVLDADQAASAPATQRKMQAEWIKQHWDRIEAESYGTAMVITKALPRLILSSILLLTPMPGRFTTVSSVDKGLAFLAEGVRLAGDRWPAGSPPLG